MTTTTTTDSNMTQGYNECDHCQSALSPAAYFVKLMETVEKYIEQPTNGKDLKSRRPDLFNKIKLDCNNTNKEKLYLEIVNQIMEENLKGESNEDILQKLATAKYPFNLPANFPLISIRAYLREDNISLAEVCKALISNVDTTLEDLDLSPEAHQMIISNDTTEGYLKEAYGTQSLDQLKKVEKFISQTDIDDKLELLLDSYNKIKKLADSAKLSIDSTNQTIINLDNQALGFLHQFIRLANKLNWSFEELSDVLVAVGKNTDFVKQIAKIKNLQDRFKQPVTKIAELYAQEDILSKKLENLSEFKSSLNSNYGKLQELAKDENSYSALQDILNVSSNELTSLIEYNNKIPSQTGKLLLFGVYKQVLLARLISISIAELTQFLSLLDIDELSSDDIERVVELNDWLKKHSITIQQLNDLVNPSELYKQQASEIGQEEKKEILYNKISKYVQIQRDILDAAYEFTTKYGQSLTEKLLHNITIFTTLKLSAEDISNIIKYGNAYGIQAKWSLSQIKTLINYNTLKDTFSSDSVTQYIDWLNGENYNENKVVEKIAQLTGWNKDTLEDIKKVEALKPCFTRTQNPIDSLMKIKSFMDLVTKSGINSKVLLSLKDLYNLKVDSDDNKWKKYTDTAENLELSAKSETKDKAEKYLAGRKRDILASYMIYKLKLRNMRDLYSHLLIDVEMSDCSVISPLKAALNSVQLYIHRSIMKLEQGVKVKPGLNEEKWKWLSSYREWEASNKIKLYPENYLNPTLRRITTPGYKTLQNTLMQGNITEEAVSNAYMDYFEDFEEVTSLKIVDSCFEKVEDKISGGEKNTLYIIGRTLAQPYNYYYRTAIFDERNQQILYWTAWEKIEASIPVETVTPIYAFHRLFLFWVQQIEKGKEGNEEKIVDVTINYIFQKPSGSWSAQQELASNVKVDPAEINKLYWKKVAAFYLKEKEGKEKNVVISMGKIDSDESCLFILDEDLVFSKRKLGCFFNVIHKYDLRKNIERTDMAIAVVGSKVILFGGKETDNFSNKIDIYDLTTNTWTTAIAAGEARSNASVAVIGTTAIFFGGFIGLKEGKNTYSKQINVYDDENGNWTVAEASEARGFSISVAVVGSKAVFFGGDKATSSGEKPNDLSKRVDIYDSVDKNWRTYETNKAHAWSAVAVIGTKAIFFGGYEDFFKTSQQIDIYDSSTDSWKYATTATARTDVAAGVIGKKAVFFGGRTYHGNQTAQFSNAIDIYNDENGEWATARINNESEARDNASVAVAGNKIIFFGGRIGDNKFSGKIDIYDSSKKENNWITSTASEAREQVSVAVIGTQAIFFGGNMDQNRHSSVVDIYNSQSNKWEHSKLNDIIEQNVGIMIQDNQIAFFAKDSSGNILKYRCFYPLLFSYDVIRNRNGKLSMNSTSNVFESNVTNKEDSAEFVRDMYPIELLGKFRISSAQQIVNKPGWFIIEGNLERENVRESFLLFPKGYDLSSISDRSTYKVDNEKVEFEYNSEIPQVDLTDTVFKFMRLNITGSVRKLRQKAYAGGPKRILTLESQTCDSNEQLKFERFEPKDRVIDLPSDCFDFSGAYGIYLWEIFFHVPTLVALHLRQEQDFATARKWYQYILNPTNDKNQTWQFLPLTQRNKESTINDSRNTQTIQELEIDPFDPYVIAKQRTTAFEKYIIKSYVDNLIDWGDMLFAKKSWEALNQATMLYVRAWDLLGHKPIKKGNFTVEAKTFEELKSNQGSGALRKLEAELPSTNTQSVKIQSTNEIYDMAKYGCYFCKPGNEEFIGLWDKVEDRLYKIRHCLDITGKRLELPLFQAPIDPRQLIQTISGSGSSVTVPSIDQLPYYRFSYMVAYARSIVETVIQFGSELLGVLEKRDAEALAILYNKQEEIMANLVTTIKEKAIVALREEAKALDASLNSAKDRKLHYGNLINVGLSAGEKKAIALSSEAIDIRTGVAVIRGVAAAAHLIPTVYGLAVGNFQPGSAIEVGANIAESVGAILNEKAQIAYTTESYKRRAEDWELQRIMASHDTEQISCQIETNKIYQDNAEQDFKAHKKSIEQIKEKEEFFKSKFTNQELYNWMKGQIAIIYFQAYKIALEIAKQAEKTYQYELNNNKPFITNSSWNSLKEGLLAGSVLKFALEQMAKDYHDKNERTFEINKVVSLGQIDPIALHDLKTKGSCKFALTERLFDLDFPGHYCRQIKNIKITIPAVVGPYENIHASLQQTSNKIVLKPDIEAIKYLLGEEGSNQPQEDVLRVNWKHNQQIAISKGDQDSGLFELNFNDERYLPFEGTGVVSNWELSLPKATNRFDTSNISDVVIHIDYTALDGGERLKGEVTKLSKLKYYHGMLVMNLSAAYPDIWEKFKQTQVKPYKLTFKPSTEIFPTYVKDPELEDSIYVIPKTSDGNQIDITMDGYNWNNTTYKSSIPLSKLAIGSDWNLDISGIDPSQIEEVTIIIPYKAKINWQAS